MTVFEWLKASSRYSFEDITYKKIALDRNIDDANDATTLSVRDKELFTADIIYTAMMLSPSSTSSLSASHNNFQKTIGSESTTDAKLSLNTKLMMSIYKTYSDPRFDILNGTKNKITTVEIEDVI